MAANPSSLCPYIYSPLNRESKQIRLLKLYYEGDLIQYDICTFNHDDAPDYVALSYTWGSPNPTFEIRVQDDKTIRVRENLYKFMQAYKDEGYLWIDQICINQSSILERNHQVAMMSDIYQRASFVLIWSQNLYLAIPYHTLHPGILDASEQARRVLADTYFSRMWVIQEILLAKEVKILTAIGATPFSDLQKWFSEIITKVRGDHKLLFVSEYGSAYQLLLKRHIVPSTLHECVKLFHKSECEDPRDRVYGLMGLVFENRRLKIDYSKSIQEVYSDVVVAFCSTYPTTTANSEEWFLTLKNLLEEMSFTSNEALALDRLLRDLWKLKTFDNPPEPEHLRHLPKTTMGFERARVRGSRDTMPSKIPKGEQDRWWYDHDGERRYYEAGTSVQSESHEDDGVVRWLEPRDDKLMECFAIIDYICAFDPAFNKIPDQE
jgi:hypothetical protein